MITIAILSDIHANLHALQAVCQDLEQVHPDQVIIDGDTVGRGPQAQETLDIIMQQGWTVLHGNHELYWMQCAAGQVPDEWQSDWWSPTRLQIEALDQSYFDWMHSLPAQTIINAADAPAIQVLHGSPRSITEGLHHHVPASELIEALGNSPYPIIAGAHTHYPMDRQAGHYRVLNCGSVGAPYNDNPAAQYLTLTWDGTTWDADFRQVHYDQQAALQYWHDSGYYETGVPAQIFAYELETATFHFWGYLKFCEAFGLPYQLSGSFNRYKQELPTYKRHCQEYQLPEYKASSLVHYAQHQA